MIDRKLIDKILGYSIAVCVSVLMLLIFISVVAVEVGKKSADERQEIMDMAKKEVAKFEARHRQNENLPDAWPPKMNEKYPDLQLFDQKGQEFRVSQLEGKVLIVEYVDMSSPISQAQSGARQKQAFGIMQEVDQFAEPFYETLSKNAQGTVTWPNEDVIHLKIIVYTQDGAQPSRDDAQNWAEHFGFERENNVIVAVARDDLRDVKTQDIVTGFQLVDKNQKLRVDSSGPAPKHNLSMTLIPLFEKLLLL